MPPPRQTPDFLDVSARDFVRGLCKALFAGLAFSVFIALSLLIGKGRYGEFINDLSLIQLDPPAITAEMLGMARRRVGTLGLLSLNAFVFGFILAGGVLSFRALLHIKKKSANG